MMKATRIIMGMPISIELVDAEATPQHIDDAFAYCAYIDQTFSTYKPDSEVSRINAGQVQPAQYSTDMQAVLQLAEETRVRSNGYFSVRSPKGLDPAGVVKGWAINHVAEQLAAAGLKNYYVEAGGDIAAVGLNAEGEPWSIGIRNPLNTNEIVKVLRVTNMGVATSGTYIRGEHIYDPHRAFAPANDIVSITVIGPNIDIADRYATAAFAMGAEGIQFIEAFQGLEGYSIDARGMATYTSGFTKYVEQQ